ncbi:hypothetical protein AX760_25435 [Pararhizobium antarcticum]|uniref:Uncharacterized protein n=1 Tax=Pararhizobium antarcticum TaxID=1798805 RepID=A0A657LYC0_9HYPH|nr:hypothetical protein AX760_25435 [Pararhizobium antarcticum]
MSGGFCPATGGPHFVDQKLKIGLLADPRQPSNRVVAAGYNYVFACLHPNKQLGQMGLGFGNLDSGTHGALQQRVIFYEFKTMQLVGQPADPITTDKGYLSEVRRPTANRTM